jgi:hypothetical protein
MDRSASIVAILFQSKLWTSSDKEIYLVSHIAVEMFRFKQNCRSTKIPMA